MFSPGDREVLDRVLMLAEAIYTNTRPRLSATLNYRPRRMGEGKGKGERKMATIRVGQTASPVYQEWSGPNGTGDKGTYPQGVCPYLRTIRIFWRVLPDAAHGQNSPVMARRIPG